MYVFIIVSSFRRPIVIGAILAPSFHKKVFRASTACAFSKHLIFVLFCENAAFRRDWCSPGHLFEGLGPHASDLGSPKWLPQAPFKATTNNSAYRCDWRSPGAPITSKWFFDLDVVHIFNNVCFAYLCTFRGSVVIRVRPAPSLDQYGLLASTACTFLRRLMFIMFGRHILTGGGEVLQSYIYIYTYIYICVFMHMFVVFGDPS